MGILPVKKSRVEQLYCAVRVSQFCLTLLTVGQVSRTGFLALGPGWSRRKPQTFRLKTCEAGELKVL